MAVAVGLRPRVHWEFELDGDWQPFSLAASATVETCHAAWLTGTGPAEVRARSGCGQLEYSVDFESMTQRTSSPTGGRAIRREAFYEQEAVEALLDQLRKEREARVKREAARKLEDADSGVATVGDEDSGGEPAQPVADDALVSKGLSWRSLEALSDRLFALPSHSIGDKPFEPTPLPVADPRRQWLEHYFLSSFEEHRRSFHEEQLCPRADIQVMYVLETYNPLSAQSYRNDVSLMKYRHKSDCPGVPELDGVVCARTDIGGPRLNEVLLFHGTSWASTAAILKEGFDTRLHGQHAGAAFGAGTYFTPVASKADFYTKRLGDAPSPQQGDPEQRVMIVSRVALGAVYEASQYCHSLRRPPASPDGMPFDSVLGVPTSRGGIVDFPEFVVYRQGQAVPQFVVCYKHRPACRCRTCVAPI